MPVELSPLIPLVVSGASFPSSTFAGSVTLVVVVGFRSTAFASSTPEGSAMWWEGEEGEEAVVGASMAGGPGRGVSEGCLEVG